MKIQLKNVNYTKKLSQETSAYSADIWIDGVKRGTVRNSGTGGPDEFQPYTLGLEIDAYAKTLPHVDCFGKMLEQNADMILSDLLNEHLTGKHLQRLMKNNTLFTAADGKIYAVKGAQPPSDAIKILNKMPFDEALKLYMGK